MLVVDPITVTIRAALAARSYQVTYCNNRSLRCGERPFFLLQINVQGKFIVSVLISVLHS